MIAFRKLTANRVSRMQVLADTSLLLVAYAALVASVVFILVGAMRRRYGMYSGSVLRSWLACEAGQPYAAAAGVLLIAVLWRAFERMHGSELVIAAVSGALAFLLISALCTFARAWRTSIMSRRGMIVIGIPSVLCVLAAVVGDGPMILLAPAAALVGLLCVDHAMRSRQRTSVRTFGCVAWGILLSIALAVGPTLMLSRMSVDYERRLQLRDAQWKLWDEESQRRRAAVQAVDAIPLIGNSKGAMREQLLKPLELDGTPIYYYGSDTSGIRLTVIRKGSTSSGKPIGTRDCPSTPESTEPPRPPSLFDSVLASIELPNEDDRRMGFDARQRGLEPAGNLWLWRQHKNLLCMYANGHLAAQGNLPNFHPLRKTFLRGGAVPGDPSNEVSPWPSWTGLITLLSVGAVWMTAVRRRLLPTESFYAAARIPELSSTEPLPWRLLVVTKPGFNAADQSCVLRAYSRVDPSVEDFQLIDVNGGILLDHFEARFHDPAVRAVRLAQLEAALQTDRPLAIVSRIDILRYIEGSAPSAETDDLSRWCAALANFDRRSLPSNGRLAILPAKVWSSCSDLEQIILRNISREGIVNPRAATIVAGLLDRGVLCRRRDRRICFASSVFRSFVAGAPLPARLTIESGLGRQRLPYYAVGLVLLGLVLFLSQEEVTTRLIAFLTTVTGGFEAIRKQLAGLHVDAGGTKRS